MILSHIFFNLNVKTRVIIFWYHIVYSYATSPKDKVNEKQVWDGKFVIKKIAHVVWCDMILSNSFVCFLSPRQGSEIENTQLDEWKLYRITKHGRSYTYIGYNMYITE
jgi:hypothetical protein